MHHPKILVTGAAGKTGSAVVRQLRERGVPVRAVVRAKDARSARSERLARLGAEVVAADLFDFEQLYAAMSGVQRAYYCPPFHPYMIRSAAAFAVAAQQAGLQSIVGLSQWLASPSHPSLSTRHHWLVDRIFAMIPEVALTIVNPGFFADYPYMAMMPYAAALGLFPMPVAGESRNAPPSTEDIARVSVAALLDPDRHAGKTYRPTGPDLLSVNDMVAIFENVLGRRVRHVQLPLWMFYKAARMDGGDPHLLSSFAYYGDEHDSGSFAFAAPTTDVFDVTGQPPESFESIVRRYAALPQNRRSFANSVTMLAKFMSIPLRPGLDARRYEIAHDVPMPSVPLYNLDNPRWKEEHAPAVRSATPVAVSSLLRDPSARRAS